MEVARPYRGVYTRRHCRHCGQERTHDLDGHCLVCRFQPAARVTDAEQAQIDAMVDAEIAEQRERRGAGR